MGTPTDMTHAKSDASFGVQRSFGIQHSTPHESDFTWRSLVDALL
jgi:hypothetical protein